MKDPTDDGRTGELQLVERIGRLREFNAVLADTNAELQRAIDNQRRFDKPKRGVSKNAAKSASKPERGER